MNIFRRIDQDSFFGKGRRARFAQSSTGSERIRFTVAFPHRVPAHSRLFAFSSFACRTADRLADVAGQSQQKRVTDTKWREYCNFVTLYIYNTILEHEKIHLCVSVYKKNGKKKLIRIHRHCSTRMRFFFFLNVSFARFGTRLKKAAAVRK